MRAGELVTAASLMLLSVYFMFHATVLPIGWVAASGPGGGAFPFWLSAIMLICGGAIMAREVYAGLSRKPRVTHGIPVPALRDIVIVSLSLIVTIALIPVIGAYIAIPLFLLFYVKFFGGHGWFLTLCLVFATPVFLFFFFEVTLKILLPKGMTEPLFIPLYAMFF